MKWKTNQRGYSQPSNNVILLINIGFITCNNIKANTNTLLTYQICLRRFISAEGYIIMPMQVKLYL